MNSSSHADQPFAFGLTRVMLAIGLGIMWGTVAMSLAGFMPPVAAVLVAALLVWLFNIAIDIVLSGKNVLMRLLALLVAIPLATITIGMSGSALWAMQFATSSLTGYFERSRVAYERQLTATLNQTRVAQQALGNWAKMTQEQATREQERGGSCPNLAQSFAGERGPVFAFRSADKTISAALASNLATWEKTLEVHVKAFTAHPKATDLDGVKAGIEVANAAVEAALPLSSGGAAPGPTLAALEKRKTEPVTADPDGAGVGCGDTARDQAIDDAITSLQALNQTQALARMEVPVDLSNPKDVVTRGWLRAASVTTSAIPFVHWPTFKDDVLWADANKRQGVIHSENLPFLMVAVVEIGVVLAKLLAKMRGAGRLPFPSTTVQTASALLVRLQSSSKTGWRGALCGAAAVVVKAWCNVFYGPSAEAAGASTPASAPTSGDNLDSGLMPVALGQNPHYGPKAEAMAREVLPFYVDWGPSAKLLVIPVIADPRCVKAHKVARHLENHAQVTLRSATATVGHISSHPTAGLVLDAALPNLDWRKDVAMFEVWETLTPFDTYLDFLAATTQPVMSVTQAHKPLPVPSVSVSGSSKVHTPLKRKLQLRNPWYVQAKPET